MDELKAENEKLRSEIKSKEERIKNLQGELMDIDQHPEKAKKKAKMESEFSTLGFSIIFPQYFGQGEKIVYL